MNAIHNEEACPSTGRTEGGADSVAVVSWPHPLREKEPLTLLECWDGYIKERCKAKGQNWRPILAVARHSCEVFGVGRDPGTLKLPDFAGYEDHRRAQGVGNASIRREFVFQHAAFNHAFRRDRITRCPYIEMPDATPAKRRPMRLDEYELLMKKGAMSYRIRMFYRLAFWTGHRSQAIEQLDWSRVHFDTRTLDFNVPGARRTTKRRVDGFPIPDELMRILTAAKERHDVLAPDDPYVITSGRGCKPTNTWRLCKLALKSVGIAEVGLCRHTVRKTFVTERIKAGKEPEKVAALIADNPQTMRKHYSVLVAEDLRKTVNF